MLSLDLRLVQACKRFQNDFEDLGQIGRGGFASVHLVRHKLDGKQYAAKIIRIEPNKTKVSVESELEQVLEEAQVHSHLAHHNIIRYHGCWIQVEETTPDEELCEPPEKQQKDVFELHILNDSNSEEEIVFANSEKEISQDNQNFSGGYKNLELSPNSTMASEQLFNKGTNGDKLSVIANGQTMQITINGPDLSSVQLHEYTNKIVSVFILVELCKQNLQSYLYRRNMRLQSAETDQKRAERRRIYKIALEVIEGLEYLHKRRFIHRDLKPQNIAFGLDGKCKIIDYGLAKRFKLKEESIYSTDCSQLCIIQMQSSPEQVGSEGDSSSFFVDSVGTRIFSSPEQASAEKYDFRTDIYSLALVIALCFSTFITIHEQKEILDRIRNHDLSMLVMPLKLREVLLNCLEKEVDRPSLAELRSCIKACLIQELKEENKQIDIYSNKSQCSSNHQSTCPQTYSPSQAFAISPSEFVHQSCSLSPAKKHYSSKIAAQKLAMVECQAVSNKK